MAEPGGGGGEGEELVECVVEFDYTAELNDELTLRVSEDTRISVLLCPLSENGGVDWRALVKYVSPQIAKRSKRKCTDETY